MSADKFDFRIDEHGRLIWDEIDSNPNRGCRPATNPEWRMWKRIAELEERAVKNAQRIARLEMEAWNRRMGHPNNHRSGAVGEKA